MTFGKRLRESIQKKDWTQAAFAEMLDVSSQTVQQWLKDDNYPTVANVLRIADILNVSPAWLLFGETGSSEDLLVAVPEYDIKFSCGNGHALFEDREPIRYVYYLRSWFAANEMNPQRVARGRISGDSMEPLLFEDDSVLIHFDETQVVDGKVYAFRVDETLHIKRLAQLPGVGLQVMSDNPKYAPYILEFEKFEGRVHIYGCVREKSGRGGL